MNAEKKSELLRGFKLTVRCILGAMFLYAGGMKVFGTGLDAFLIDVRNFHLVQEPLDLMTAYTLPYLEMICGVLLLLGIAHKAAAWCAVAMTVVFLYAVNHARMNGIDLHCGCFGHSLEAVRYPEKLTALAVQLIACLYATR